MKTRVLGLSWTKEAYLREEDKLLFFPIPQTHRLQYYYYYSTSSKSKPKIKTDQDHAPSSSEEEKVYQHLGGDKDQEQEGDKHKEAEDEDEERFKEDLLELALTHVHKVGWSTQAIANGGLN